MPSPKSAFQGYWTKTFLREGKARRSSRDVATAKRDRLPDVQEITADHLQRYAPDVPSLLRLSADRTDPDWLQQAFAYFTSK